MSKININKIWKFKHEDEMVILMKNFEEAYNQGYDDCLKDMQSHQSGTFKDWWRVKAAKILGGKDKNAVYMEPGNFD